MKYKVALRRTDEGFSVSCPGLPGCWSQGKTEQEALANIADAITEYLAVSAALAETEDTEVREVEVAA
jgi:predicted RNase H-like HicB family nuclease